MKYCPYCGAILPDGTASFCNECGEHLPTEESSQKKATEQVTNPQMRKKKEQGSPSSKSRKKRKTGSGGRTEVPLPPKDDGYDGYYDDILPSDAGKLNEGVDLDLVKRISAVMGIMLLIVILCVVAMYLL